MFGCDLVKGLSGYDERKQRGKYIDGMASCVSFFLRVFVYDLFRLLVRLQCCVNEADMESVGVSVVW